MGQRSMGQGKLIYHLNILEILQLENKIKPPYISLWLTTGQDGQRNITVLLFQISVEIFHTFVIAIEG